MSAPDTAGFDDPWHLQAFALTHALADAKVITWTEWTETLSRHLHAPDARTDGADYYDRWVAALEEVLTRQGLTEQATIADLTEAWQRAARATPHGQPIELAAAEHTYAKTSKASPKL